MEQKEKIKFEIITPIETIYSDLVDRVILNTIDGQITAMPRHMPLISIIDIGEIILRKGNEKIYINSSSGIVEIKQRTKEDKENKITKIIILTDSAQKMDKLK